MHNEKKNKEIKKLSTTELAFMNVIWDHSDGITSEEIYTYFNQATGTKSTILHRIIEKGFVQTIKKGRHYIYIPIIAKADYEQTVMSHTILKLDKIIAAFCNQKNLSEKQLDKVKQFLTELEELDQNNV